MPLHLAMSSKLSRTQFHACAQELYVENQRLAEQVAALQVSPDSWQSGYDEGRKMGTKTALSEREQFKAENESLRKSATRYEWLRDEHTRPGCLSSDPDKAKWLDEYLMCGDQLDAAIDEQLAKVKQS